LPRLHDAAARAAGLMHEQAAGAVSSPRYDRLMQALQRWLDRRAWREALTGRAKSALKTRAGDFAAATFEQDRQRLLKRGRKLKDATSEQRHRMRIAAKRARYATEFFASLYPKRRVRRYVAALASLQDELGWMNDAAVAERLLGELVAQHEDVRDDAGLVRGLLASGAADGVAQVRKRWKKLRPLAAPH
jgi:CHAD domain-containing protein